MASLQGTCISLRTDRDFPKGQEVVASYGHKSSGDLLVSYGFVPPPGTNPHDTYTLTLRVWHPAPCIRYAQHAVGWRKHPQQTKHVVPTFTTFQRVSWLQVSAEDANASQKEELL